VDEQSDNEASVKKTPRRGRVSQAGQTEIPQSQAATIPLSEFQSHAQEILSRRFADILESMAQKSVEGSLPHTKYLFEICGVNEELQRLAQNEGEPSLAELLLAEVRRHRELEAGSPAEPASEETGGRADNPRAALADNTKTRDENCGANAK
jgi:hypothetical protein